jgi:hypothetical protein
MAAYDVEPWSDLFVAGAALAGLVFVAVSINIDRILALKGLAERGLETVVTLLVVVIVALAGLIPGQSTVALGVELLLIAVVYLGLIIKLWPSVRPPWTWTFGRRSCAEGAALSRPRSACPTASRRSLGRAGRR